MFLTLAIAALIALGLGGLWLGVVLGLAGTTILYSTCGVKGFSVIIIATWNLLRNFALIALPLYILLGEIFVSCGISRKIYSSLSPLLERFPGKLLLANTVFCALFGACVGSSMATAAAIGSAAYPEMTRKGYNRQAVVGNLAGAGTLGVLVPPSSIIIIYGILTDTSIGSGFIACIIPALMLVLMFSIFIIVMCSIHPGLVPHGEDIVPLKRALIQLTGVFPIFILIFAIMGTIYLGVATPTEAAGLGVMVTIIISIAYRTFSFKNIGKALLATARVCGVIGFVIFGAMILAMSVAMVGIPRSLILSVEALDLSPTVVLFLVYLLYMVLGCFLGAIEMIVVTIPFTFPLLMALGYDPLWFAVALVIVCEIGQLTPPVGVNLFVLQSITEGEVGLGEVAKGAVPYFLILGLLLALITVFPPLCTWLPYRG